MQNAFKRFLSAALALAMVFTMIPHVGLTTVTAVGTDDCEHVWVDSVCTECEAVCTHDWADPTCTAPKTCNICTATEGVALDHTLDENNYCSGCETTFLAYLDFEDGQVSGTTSTNDDVDGTMYVQVSSVNDNKVLELYRAKGVGPAYWYYDLGGTYDKVTLTYNIAMSSTVIRYAIFPTIAASFTTDMFNSNVLFGQNGGTYIQYNKSTWTNIATDEAASMSAQANRWYTVKVVYSNDNDSTNDILYIDGLKTNAEVRTNADVGVISILMPSHASFDLKYYVDNIRVTTGGVDHEPAVPACLSSHTYDQQVIIDRYKVSGATCSAAAVYYYSCACGARGTETFTLGEALGHDFGSDGKCQNEGCEETCNHEKFTDDVCDACGYECPHTNWNPANCTLGEHCAVCGKEEGAKGTDHVFGDDNVCDVCGTTVLADLDFEGENPVIGTITGADSSDTYGGVENGVLHLGTSTKAASAITWYYPLGTTLDNIVLSYNFAAANGGGTPVIRFPAYSFQASVSPAVFGVQASNDIFWAEKGSGNVRVTTGEGDSLKSYTISDTPVWHTVKIVYYKDTAADQGYVVELYLDGNKTNITKHNNDALSNINHIAAQISANYTGHIYIDNVYATTGEVGHVHLPADPTVCLCDEPTWGDDGICDVCQAHCEHDWAAASCTAPKTCNNCGKTEGTLGHNIDKNTQKCTECGRDCPHGNWTENYICNDCGYSCTHDDWNDATCTSPKTCKTCNLTEGGVLEHNMVNGECTMCHIGLIASFDFETDAVGERPNNILTDRTETDYTVEVKDLAGNKVLAVGTNAAEGDTVRLQLWYELPASYNEVTLSYKILQVSARQSNFLTVTNSSLSNPTVRFGTGTTDLRAYGYNAEAPNDFIALAAADENETVSYAVNQWHIVQIVYAKSGVCKVFIDGILTNVTTHKEDAISRIGMYVAGNHTQVGDAFYIDDIRVTEGIGADGNGSHEVELPEVEDLDWTLDFEDETVDARPDDIHTNLAETDTSYSIKVTEVAGNKVLSVGTQAAEGETVRLEWWYELPAAYNEVTLSYKIMQVSARQSNFLTVTNSSLSNPSVRFGTGTTNLRYYDGSANAAAQDLAAANADESITYALNKWHVVKIVYAKSGACKVFIDGILTNVTTTKTEAISYVGMYVAGNHTQVGDAFYIDDIRVTEGVGADGNGSHEVEIPEPEVDPNKPQVNPDGSLLSKDFEDETVGARPNLIVTDRTETDYTVEVKDVAGNKVLAVGTNAAEGDTVRLQLWYELPDTYNEVTLSYKIMQVSARQSNFLTVTNSSLSNPTVRFGTGTTNLRYYDGSANAAAQDLAAANADESVTYALNKWHVVKIVYAKSGVCKVFIDGILTNVTTTKTDAISRIGMYVAGNHTQVGDAFYIDDIYVTEGIGADGNGSHEVEIPEPEVDPNKPQVNPDGSLLSKDFEDETVGARPNLIVTDRTETDYTVEVKDVAGNKVLAVGTNAAEGDTVRLQLWYELPDTYNEVTLSYKIMQVSARQSNFLTVTNSSLSNPTVRFGTGSTDLRAYGYSAEKPNDFIALAAANADESVTHVLNKWHVVKIVYAKSGVCKVFIDGVLTNVTTHKTDAISRVGMYLAGNDKQPGDGFYIDDIYVTEGIGADGNGSHEVEIPEPEVDPNKPQVNPDGSLLSKDFEDETVGARPNLIVTDRTGTDYTLEVKDVAGNKVLAVGTNAAEGDTVRLQLWYELPDTYNEVTLSYKIMQVSARQSNFLTVTNSSLSNPTVRFGTGSTDLRAYGYSAEKPNDFIALAAADENETVTHGLNKWHVVKIVYSKSGVCKVFIDGILTNVTTHKTDAISRVGMYLAGNDKQPGDGFYIDDIYVTEGVGADGNGSHEVEIPEPEVDPNRPQVAPNGDLIHTDFESDALDARPAGWVTNMDENAEATGYSLKVMDFEENKVLAVKVDPKVDFQMWHMLPTDQTKLTLSYHIYQVAAGISFFPTVSTSRTFSPTVTFGVLSTALKYTGKWADLLPRDSSEAINYKLNKWQSVKVVYDKTAEVPVKVFINGVLTNVETDRFETIDRIAMRLFGNGGQFYIDNIRVTSGVGDDGNGSHEVAELPKREELPAGVLMDMDFENVSDGQLPKYSMFGVNGMNTPQDTDECYAGVKTINGNKVLVFRVDQGYSYLSWYYPFEEPHDKVTISYHVAKPDATGGWMDFPTVSTAKTPTVPLVQYGVNTIFGKPLVFCDNSKRNGMSIWNDIKPEGTVGDTGQFYLEELKWYEVKMVYETRENEKEADVKVYIDGVLTNVYAVTEETNAPAENLLIRITKNGGYIYYDNIKVTVDDHEPAEKPAYPKDPDVVVSTIVPSVKSLTLPSGGHGFLTATAMPENATDRTLVYTSSDPEIATVDQWGEVIGLKPGNVTITVTPVLGAEGVKLEIPVTITEKSVMQTIYVSNEGGGNGSSETSRCTLKEAMAKVSAIKTMTGDIVVSLAPGYYQQTETLKFNETHGGKNNYYVIYKAEGEVTFGGKKVITGWTDEDGDGIYSAPAAGIQTRHLYVNNVRAVRARSQEGLNRVKYLTDSEDNNIGYICNDVELADFAYPEDLEMVYIKSWHHMRCGVDSVKVVDDKLHITMTMPGFDYLRDTNGRFIVYYENALELLDEPGEWYLDTHKGVVYYMPREWEDMSQVEISAAVVEDLIWVEGSDYDNMVQNIQFEGITFADTTWNRPTEVEHHSAYQNNYITNERDENGNKIPDYLPDAAVTVKRANTVNFVGCTFTRMGIMGLKMVEGVQNSRIVGNKFYDISGNAIAIGEADYNNKDVFGPKDIRMMMKNCDILNNYIHHTGVDYQSSAAISVGWGADIDISYNEVFDTPYSGTHIGYGWQNVFANVLINLKMEHNFFHDTLVGDTNDGGAFYFNGMSGGNENNWNLISENYIRNTLHGEASFYNDAGSTYYEYSNNVIDESERNDIVIKNHIRMGAWVCGANYGQIWRARHNYVTVNKMAYVDEFADAKDTIVCEPNNYPAEALKIIEEAGLQSEYLHLQNGYAERVFTNFGYLMDLAEVGSTYKVEMFAFDGKDNGTSTVANPDLKVLKFYMEDTKIATVTDDGLVTAVKKGQTSLFVTVQSGTILKTLEYPVYVGDKLEEIVVDKAENGLMLYMTDAPRALSAYGLTGKDRKVVLQNVKYEVADARIASVTEDGILAPLSVGKTILRVTGEYFGNSVTTDIELNVERTPRFVLHNMWEIFDDQYKTNWSNGQSMAYSENKITKVTDGFTKFTGRLFGNELMSFTLRVDKLDEDRYPWISVRAQDPDFNTTMDTGYVFVFGERNGLELHRFNNGMRTQIYGNLSAYEPLGGPAIKGKFEWGKDYDIQLGALTEENGVRLILRINGEEIINFLDTSTDAIRQMGYFDMSFQGTMSLMKNTDIPDKMELIAGGNGEWLLGSNQEYRFESSIDIGELPIYLNGELLDSQYYSLSGNTIILTAECMESLGKGIHILEVLDPKYGDNVRLLSAIFEVVSEFSEDDIDDGNDDIGGTNKDSSTLKTVLLVVLIVAALGCVAAVVVLMLKRKRSAE